MYNMNYSNLTLDIRHLHMCVYIYICMCTENGWFVELTSYQSCTIGYWRWIENGGWWHLKNNTQGNVKMGKCRRHNFLKNSSSISNFQIIIVQQKSYITNNTIKFVQKTNASYLNQFSDSKNILPAQPFSLNSTFFIQVISKYVKINEEFTSDGIYNITNQNTLKDRHILFLEIF